MGGIVTARAHVFFDVSTTWIYILHSLGICISFSGVALFASGLKTRVIEKVRLCPHCYYKNPAGSSLCIKCKKEIKAKSGKDPDNE